MISQLPPTVFSAGKLGRLRRLLLYPMKKLPEIVFSAPKPLIDCSALFDL